MRFARHRQRLSQLEVITVQRLFPPVQHIHRPVVGRDEQAADLGSAQIELAPNLPGRPIANDHVPRGVRDLTPTQTSVLPSGENAQASSFVSLPSSSGGKGLPEFTSQTTVSRGSTNLISTVAPSGDRRVPRRRSKSSVAMVRTTLTRAVSTTTIALSLLPRRTRCLLPGVNPRTSKLCPASSLAQTCVPVVTSHSRTLPPLEASHLPSAETHA